MLVYYSRDFDFDRIKKITAIQRVNGWIEQKPPNTLPTTISDRARLLFEMAEFKAFPVVSPTNPFLFFSVFPPAHKESLNFFTIMFGWQRDIVAMCVELRMLRVTMSWICRLGRIRWDSGTICQYYPRYLSGSGKFWMSLWNEVCGKP